MERGTNGGTQEVRLGFSLSLLVFYYGEHPLRCGGQAGYFLMRTVKGGGSGMVVVLLTSFDPGIPRELEGGR